LVGLVLFIALLFGIAAVIVDSTIWLVRKIMTRLDKGDGNSKEDR